VKIKQSISGNCGKILRVATWSFLTNHARVLVCIALDPAVRLRDIAASLGITERSAHGIVTDLADAGYVIKQKDGRRNRYQIQAHLPLPEPGTSGPAIGEVLALLADAGPAGHPAARANLPAGSGNLPALPVSLTAGDIGNSTWWGESLAYPAQRWLAAAWWR
jgi:hypothetical protein